MATDIRKKIIKPIIIFVILIFLISIFAWVAVHFIDMSSSNNTDTMADQTTNYTWEEQSQDYQINVPKNLNINLSGNNQ